MQDEREWVPVEVTWDEDLAHASDEIEWDVHPWVNEPLYDPRPRPIYPPLPPGFSFPARSPTSARAPESGGKRRDERNRPKRQKADAQLSKRKRKKLRAWDIEDEA